MSVIKVRCTDQVLKITEAPVVASGGKNEVKVEFQFCEKWDGFTKTAVFYRDIEEPYYALLNSEDVCVVPWEVYTEAGTFYFSVFGDKEETRRTATTVRYKVKDSGLPEGAMPSDPTPDIYSQIMASISRIEEGQKDYVDEAFAPKIEDIKETTKNDVLAAVKEDLAEINNQIQNVESAAQNNFHLLENALAELSNHVEDLHYKPIEITSCSVSPSVAEMGSRVTSATVSWNVNKNPASQSVEGESVDASLRSKQITGLSLIADKSFSVRVQDERDLVDSDSAWLRFHNGVYYGALAADAVINSSAILSLTRSLQAGKSKTFTATAGEGQKFAYALPSRYGTPAFNIGGFDYVWTKAATFDFTNASGYTEQYDVWLNDEVVVGTRTIKVT